MEPDFSGYATKFGVECSDGLTIDKGAFAHYDKRQLPLVWSHDHSDPNNVLGHAIIEHRADGSYVHGYFNDTPNGQIAKTMVQHEDIKSLSIYANRLIKGGKNKNLVQHGELREVSLVIAGANPEASIEKVYLRHSDGSLEEDETEGIIRMMQPLELEHSGTSKDESEEESKEGTETETESTASEAKEVPQSEPTEAKEVPQTEPTDAPSGETKTPANDSESEATNLEHADSDKESTVAEPTVEDVYNALTEEQKKVVDYLIGSAIADADLEHANQEGNEMSRNVFDQNETGVYNEGPKLQHSEIQTIMTDAVSMNSLKKSVLAHAGDYGIDNIDLLFPDARLASTQPDLIARQADWVPKVLGGTKHVPYAKIKSVTADLTAEEARAKGYIKGTEKKEEVIPFLRRTTGPTTVYKKQKLDRDDILDITDFDIVAWLKWEIRFMLDEEVARAILIGDGRSTLNPDKIKDPVGATDGVGIRSIANDHDLYAIKLQLAANVSSANIIKEVTRARTGYRGSGTPTLYTTDRVLVDMLLLEDKMGRRLYDTEVQLAAALRVKEIVPVEVMEETPDILGIIVNLVDYSVGTNQGGEVNFFDDFDIDFNQEKYLMETRLSGALTKPKSAIVIRREQGTEVTPTAPNFNGETNTISVPTKAGVIYTIDGDLVTGNVVITKDTTLEAEPDDDYYFPAGTNRSWSFVYND